MKTSIRRIAIRASDKLRHEFHRSYQHLKGLLSDINLWLVLGTWLLAVVGYLAMKDQHAALDSQLTQMKANSKQEEARASAQRLDTEQAIALQQKQMRMEIRGWLAVSVESKTFRITAGKPVSVSIQVMNTGKTVATAITAIVAIQRIPAGQSVLSIDAEQTKMIALSYLLPPLFPNLSNVEEQEVTWYVRGARSTAPPTLASTDDVVQFRSGQIYFVVSGRIFYEDVFGRQHWTEFCDSIPERENFPRDFMASLQCKQLNGVDKNDGDPSL